MSRRITSLIAVALIFVILLAGYAIFSKIVVDSQPNTGGGGTAAPIVVAADDYRKVTALSYTKDGETIDLTYNTNTGKWIYDAQPKLPIDIEIPSYMAAAIAQIQAERIVTDSRENFSEYGFDTPTVAVTIHFDDIVRSYFIGDYNTSAGGYYFNVVGSDTVYIIAPGLLPYFEYSLLDLLVPETLPILASKDIEVKSIVVDGLPLSSEQIADYIAQTATLSLDSPIGYAVTDSELAKYGFDKSNKTEINYTVAEKVSNEEGSIASTVYLDKSFTLICSSETEGTVFAKTAGSPVVYKISSDIVFYSEIDKDADTPL